MLKTHLGEISALITALCWTITALAFESASLKVGSIAVNLIRLCFAFIFLGVFNYIFRGYILPIDASTRSWILLIASGLIGFVIGDLFLFESYTIIGSRIAMLIMTLVPPITSIISYFILGEHLTLKNISGMFLTLLGISMVIINKNNGEQKLKITHSLKGLLFAFIGAVGQAFGLVLSKLGMGNYNAFAATQIRIIAGVIGFIIVISFWRKWENVGLALKNKQALNRITLGSVFGPFLGVSLSLFAVQRTNAGIASTLMSIVPILIIPPSIYFFKQKIRTNEIIGAIISVIGVTLFFI